MPQLQVIKRPKENPEPTVQEFFSKLGKDFKDREDQLEIGKILGEYQHNRQDANAWEDAQLNLERSNISPTRRLQAQNTLNNSRKLITDKDRALNKQVKQMQGSAAILSPEERTRQKKNLRAIGMSDAMAEFYLDSPPGVQQNLSRFNEEYVSRQLRRPENNVPEQMRNQQSPTEILREPSQTNNIMEERSPVVENEEAEFQETELPSDVSSTPAIQEKVGVKNPKPVPEEEWAPPVIPTHFNAADRVKWENSNQSFNNKELKQSQERKKTLAENGRLVKNMTNLNDTHKIATGAGRVIIDPKTGDLRPTAQLAGLVNPETQLYVKDLKRWLKGGKDIFGARLTNFDVSSYMQQLPGLLNSENGRRIILKTMEYVNDLDSIYNNTLNEALTHYGRNASYDQIIKEVNKKVSEREVETIGRINNLVKASTFINKIAGNPDKYKGYTAMQTPEGQFRAVPNNKVEQLKAKKWRDF